MGKIQHLCGSLTVLVLEGQPQAFNKMHQLDNTVTCTDMVPE
jgi:hypothetical protein